MSVRQLSDTVLRLECDGAEGSKKACPNHYEVAYTHAGLAAANEWLQRHGWRTLIDGNKQIHLCVYCANKDSRLNLNKRTRSAPQSTSVMSGKITHVCVHYAPGYGPCGFCNNPGNLLCDYPVSGDGRTCDARMCIDCCTRGESATDSPTIDYCPIHKGKMNAGNQSTS